LDQEESAENDFGGDYDKSYANNDMAFADESNGFMQQLEELGNEEERQKNDAFMEGSDDDGGDDDDENSLAGDDDDDDETAAKKARKEADKTSGAVDDDVLLQAKNAAKKLESHRQKLQTDMNATMEMNEQLKSQVNSSSSSSSSSSRKRDRDEANLEDEDEDDKDDKNTKRNKQESTSTSTSTGDITENEIRSYLKSQGGSSTLDNLKNYFKKQVKMMNKKKKDNGKIVLTNIIKSIAKITVDAIQGKMIVLK